MNPLSWTQWAVLSGVAFAISVGQILFKMTSSSLGARDSIVIALLRNPTFWTAMVLYGCATIAWILVIKAIPISRAYMFMALTYVFVPLLSAFFIGEKIEASNVLAVCLILSGVAVSAFFGARP